MLVVMFQLEHHKNSLTKYFGQQLERLIANSMHYHDEGIGWQVSIMQQYTLHVWSRGKQLALFS